MPCSGSSVKGGKFELEEEGNMLRSEISQAIAERLTQEVQRGILNGLSNAEPILTGPEFVRACLEKANIQTADIEPWVRFAQALVSHLEDAIRQR